MLHLKITMAVPCYLVKVSLALFPLHTKCNRVRKKPESPLGKKSKCGRCLLPTPSTPCPLQKQSPGEQSTCWSGWRCRKSQPDIRGLKIGEVSAVRSCSSSTSTHGLKYVWQGAFPVGGLSDRREGSSHHFKGLAMTQEPRTVKAYLGHSVFH